MEKHKKLKWDYYFRIEPFGSFFRKRFIIATSSRRLKLYTLKSILKSTKIDRCKTANNFIHSGTRKIYGLVKVVDKRKQI